MRLYGLAIFFITLYAASAAGDVLVYHEEKNGSFARTERFGTTSRRRLTTRRRYGCQAGKYDVKTTSSLQCADCPAGKYQNAIAQTACIDCLPGKYQPYSAYSYCWTCPSGSYQTSTAATICRSCEANKYKATTTSCVDCPSGTTTHGLTGLSSSSLCFSCPPGQYLDINTCRDCPENTFSIGSVLKCTPCSPGTFSPPVASVCSACGNSTNAFLETPLTCSPCMFGRYSNGADQTTCYNCPSGRYVSLHGCRDCPVGKYSPKSRSSACLTCSPGFFSTAAATVCSSCPPGMSSRAGSSICTACDAGTFAAISSPLCVQCPAGRSQSSEEASSCVACTTGKFASQLRSTACSTCAAGSFSTATASTICTACPAGFSATPDLQVLPTSQTVACTPCIAGKFADTPGLITCARCSLGKFSATPGASTCISCSAGSFSASPGASVCTVCPPGEWAPSGASMCAAALNCDTNPCLNGGTCVPGRSMCTCAPLWLGPLCAINVAQAPCASSPCATPASACINSDDALSFQCVCPPGLTGTLCDVSVNECVSSPCHNNATCHNTLFSFSCSCSSGTSGRLCDLIVDSCVSSPCANGGACSNTLDGFHCTCTAAFTGRTCSIILEACSSFPCANGGTCVTGPSRFSVTQLRAPLQRYVRSWFYFSNAPDASCNGTLTVVATNAVLLTSAYLLVYGPFGVITRVFDSPLPPGQALYSQSVELTPETIGSLRDSSNTIVLSVAPTSNIYAKYMSYLRLSLDYPTFNTGFSCACPVGYTGSTCETVLGDCASEPCSNGGTCLLDNTGQFLMCVCPHTNTGTFCQSEIVVRDCDSSPCANGGFCTNIEPGTPYIHEIERTPAAYDSTLVFTFPLVGLSTLAGGTLMIASNADLRSPSETILIAGANGFSRTFFSNDWTTDCVPRYDQVPLSAADIADLRGGGTSITFTATFSTDVTSGICAQPTLRLALSFVQANTYKCNCSAGYTGTQCETPLNDCLVTPCLNGGTCIPSLPSFPATHSTCDCPVGFAGPFCESSVPINECMSSPCSNGATCVPELAAGAFTCACLAGFTGVSCESNIDECASSPCNPFTTVHCLDGIASFVCECTTGLGGTLCNLPDQCFSSPCANGGVCSTVSLDGLLQYSCECPPRYSGANCDVVIGDCASSPCLNGAVCQEDGAQMFISCQCLTGYTGTFCGEVLDVCLSSPCANGGSCTQPAVGVIQCLCAADYTGELCDMVIDDCESSPCAAGATCVDGIASYVCECLPGIGGLWCTIVDQCLSSPCSNGATCTSRGQFWSSATQGPVVYTDTLVFNFPDAKAPVSGGTLEVEVGNGNLRSSSEYVTLSGNGWLSDRLFESSSSDCTLQTTTVSLSQVELAGLIVDGSISLEMTASSAVGILSCPSGKPSYAKLTLLYSFAPRFICECPAIYSGPACETLSGVCISSPCQNDGECLVNEFGSFQGCRCGVGYSGPFCEWVLDACASSPCMHGGSCLGVQFVSAQLLFQCICLQGFTGLDCGVIIDYCASSPCPLTATCISGTAFATCICAPGTAGSLCELPDLCTSSPCENGGLCSTMSTGVYSQDLTLTPVQDELVLPFPFTGVPQPVGDSTLLLKSNASYYYGELTIAGPGGFLEKGFDYSLPDTCGENSQTLSINQTVLTALLSGGDSFTLAVTPNIAVACTRTFLNMQLQVNTGVTFSCDCPAGWYGTTCGVYARSCASSPCLNGGTCMDAPEGGFTCSCANGYSGLTCNRRDLACESSPCLNGATCTNVRNIAGYYRAVCLCAVGFTGLACETDIDDCLSSPCTSASTCVDGINTYTCVCPLNSYGSRCNIYSSSNWCSSTPCLNGGMCSMRKYESVTATHDYTLGPSQLVNFTFDNLLPPTSAASLEATARLYLSGSSSFFTVLGTEEYNQTFFGDSGNPCTRMSTETLTLPGSEMPSLYTNGAITLQVLLSEGSNLDLCTDLLPFLQLRLTYSVALHVQCDCPFNFTGEFCETLLGGCASLPCGAGTCNEDDSGQFSGCLCPMGFTGAYCETPVDFCVCSPCANGATCRSSTVGYTCECPIAFSGPLCRMSLDMCASSPCALGATCAPYAGGFRCICTHGLAGPRCTIPNLCLSSPCAHGGSCESLGSVTLTQTQGVPLTGPNRGSTVFTLAGRPPTGSSVIRVATNADVSPLDDVLLLGGADRFAELFFRESLPVCAVANETRALSTAQTASLFSTDTGAFHLSAVVPGRSCFSDVFVWLSLSYDVNPFVQCSCPAGFTGEYCEILEAACTSSPCGALGTCVQDIFGAFQHCACPLGTTGVFCETIFDACHSAQNPCLNGATCLPIFQMGSVGYGCSCTAGFEGDDCGVNIDDCASSPCANGSTCVDGVQAYGCQCVVGTTGPSCSEMDFCASTPCRNGVSCVNAPAGATYSSEVRHDISFQGAIPQFVFRGTPQTSVTSNLLVIANANLRYSSYYITISGASGFVENVFNTGLSNNCQDLTDSVSLTATQLNGLINTTSSTITLTATLVSSTPVTCNAPFVSLQLHYTSAERFVYCTCEEGFTGALCDTVVPNNECDSSPCPIFATCVPGAGSGWKCVCPPLLTGVTCQIANPCISSPCSIGGICSSFGGDVDMTVTVNPTGSCCVPMVVTFSNLEVPIGDGTLLLESNADLGTTSEYFTVSLGGSSFSYVAFKSPETDCVTRTDSVIVPLQAIQAALSGSVTLSFEIVGSGSVSYTLCSNTFVKVTLQYPSHEPLVCSCSVGYTGTNCETLIDNCASNPCFEGATCVNGVASFLCLCPSGRGGVHCAFADRCGSSPCANGGVCQTIGYVQETVLASPLDKVVQLNFSSLTQKPIGDGNLTITVVGSMRRTNGDSILVTAPGGLLFGFFNNYPFPSGACTTGTQAVSFPRADIEAMLDAGNPTSVVFTSTPLYVLSRCAEFTYVSLTVQYPTEPEYMCTCGPGFTGVDCTHALDPCFSSPCHHGGSCETAPTDDSAAVCICASGFTGAACEVDLMGCGSSPCTNGGSCLMLSSDPFGNQVVCVCALGFTGSMCEAEIDECLSAPCPLGFVCVEGVNTFTCLRIACASAPCLNGATCVNSVDDFECQCSHGFEGDQCESTVNFCQSAPCQKGSCNAWTGGFDCVCDTGYTGPFCESELNECESSPCGNGASCVDKIGRFMCVCLAGFTGTFCDIDVIGDCATDWCNRNGICRVVSGGRGYECDCLPGYEGSNCETMIDYCSSSPCLFGACSSVPSGFQCNCPSSWEGTFCEIYNPCPPSCLLPGAECLMNYTSTSIAQTTGPLSSPNGYVLTLTNVPYVSPTYNAGPESDGELILTILADVGQGTRLHVVGVSFQAQIVLDYGGPQCLQRQHAFLLTATQIRQMLRVDGRIVILVEIINGPPLATACTGAFIRAELKMGVPTEEVTCSCSAGNSCKGCGCSLQVGCQSCANNAGCTSDGQCVCAEGYYGSTCAFQFDICASSPCMNGGECHILTNHFYCDCPIGFLGSMCQSKRECMENPCMGYAACVETTDGSFAGCLCGPGTTGVYCETFLLSCTSQPCLNNGTCIDFVDQYVCECAVGTTGVQCEVVVDECTSQPCANGATCQSNEFGHTCMCVPGFQGALCDVNTNECESSPCSNGATCEDRVGSFVCACQSGWFGPLCNADVDECGSLPCLNGATCVDTVDGFLCECVAGYTGVTCNTLVMPCTSSPCQNGGFCAQNFNLFVCNCRPGFTGVHCEESTDECSSSPCLNGGVCTNTVNGYTCGCGSGFTGDQCELDIDECASSPCANGGTCTQSVGVYMCDCAPGFTGDTCNESVDECTSQPCANGGICTDLVNSYACHCSPGFTGVRCEVDMDECASSPCASNAVCRDGANVFACACALGFTGVHCDEQIDECESAPCSNGATCLDGFSSFLCVCATGWLGHLCDEDVDECLSSPCANGARCEDGIGGATCICWPGFTGSTCALEMDECMSSPCANEAQCVDNLNTFTCVCATGFTGRLCNINIDECASLPCVNGGECVSAAGSFLCICPSGFTGAQCDVVAEVCASSPCTNGAPCIADVSGFTCVCAAGFTGVRCEVLIPGCMSLPCLNGATCVNGVDSFTCLCESGWYGRLCDADIDECASSPCTNSASCEDIVDGFACGCAAGFTGVHCEVDIDECASSPCTNSASCEDIVDGFACGCAAGFTGVRCEVDIDECASSPCTYGCMDGVASFMCVAPNDCASSPCSNGASCVAALVTGFSCVCADGFFGEDCTSSGKFITALNGGTIAAPGFQITFPPEALSSTAFVSVTILPSGSTGVPSAPSWASVASHIYHIVSAGASTFALVALVEIELLPGAGVSNSTLFFSPAASSEFQRLDGVSVGRRRSGGCPANTVCNSITQPGFVVALSAQPCASSPCANDATCVATSAAEFVCACALGFEGVLCETTVNVCASSPCENGGVCLLGPTGVFFTCTCASGFVGGTCETAISACASSPCTNGASCVGTATTYSCLCSAGFAGVECETDIDECASSPCASGELCDDGVASYMCTSGAGASSAVTTTHFVIVGVAGGVALISLLAIIAVVLILRRHRHSTALQLNSPQRRLSQRELMRSESIAEHSQLDSMMMDGLNAFQDATGDASDDTPMEFTFATCDLMEEEVA